jgi:hypothetical protein
MVREFRCAAVTKLLDLLLADGKSLFAEEPRREGSRLEAGFSAWAARYRRGVLRPFERSLMEP